MARGRRDTVKPEVQSRPFNPLKAMNETHSYGPETKKARVEIIPLIDVVFFLLATFVLFTLSLQKLSTLPVPLPKAGGEAGPSDTVYLQASEDGAAYWRRGNDGAAELVSIAEVPARLRDYRRSTAQPRVFIRSDARARFGDGVLLLDEVRKAGIDQVSIETVVTRTGG